MSVVEVTVVVVGVVVVDVILAYIYDGSSSAFEYLKIVNIKRKYISAMIVSVDNC